MPQLQIGEYQIKNLIVTGKHTEQDGKNIYLCLVSLSNYLDNVSCIFQSYNQTEITEIKCNDFVLLEPTNDYCSCYVLWRIEDRSHIILKKK